MPTIYLPKAAFTRAILRVGGPLHLTADTQKAVGCELVELECVLLQLASDTVIYATANQFNSIQYILFASPLCVIVSM